MTSRSPFVDTVVHQLNCIAPVTARAMFGGYGIYSKAVMFGVIAEDVLYFKIDDQSRADYIALGSEPFIYHRKGKPIEMSYYRLPDQVFENLDQLLLWFETSYAIAVKSKAKTVSKPKKWEFKS